MSFKPVSEYADTLIGTENAGYIIEAARPIKDQTLYGVALGQHDSPIGKVWVTWEFNYEPSARGINFYWGHYHMTDEAAARKDYAERGQSTR